MHSQKNRTRDLLIRVAYTRLFPSFVNENKSLCFMLVSLKAISQGSGQPSWSRTPAAWELQPRRSGKEPHEEPTEGKERNQCPNTHSEAPVSYIPQYKEKWKSSKPITPPPRPLDSLGNILLFNLKRDTIIILKEENWSCWLRKATVLGRKYWWCKMRDKLSIYCGPAEWFHPVGMYHIQVSHGHYRVKKRERETGMGGCFNRKTAEFDVMEGLCSYPLAEQCTV